MTPTDTNGKQCVPGGELCPPSVRKEKVVLSERDGEGTEGKGKL